MSEQEPESSFEIFHSKMFVISIVTNIFCTTNREDLGFQGFFIQVSL